MDCEKMRVRLVSLLKSAEWDRLIYMLWGMSKVVMERL